MMFLPGWIEVHGWAWGGGIQYPATPMLFQVAHLVGVAQQQWQGETHTTLFVPGTHYGHIVEESVEQVQALIVQALRGGHGA